VLRREPRRAILLLRAIKIEAITGENTQL
jgi:hypothetical protein